jgi:hypothetical protein
MTALGKSVTLPDATTVTVGSPKFYLNNASGAYPVGIRNTSGTLLMAIAAGGTAFVSCQDVSTAAGVWNITGDNLEPGLITIDNTFSSTYTSTRLLPFVAFDSNKSLHFLELSSGFAAVAVDNTTGAVGTPVTVSATASMAPRSVFLITSTTAIVFYSNTSGTLIGAVISLSSATTLTVGTPSSTLTDAGVAVEDFSGAPKIAQLDTTLYLVSWATADEGDTSVAAFQVSGGTTVTLGSTVKILTGVDSRLNSTTTFGLTTTTGFVIYNKGPASPKQIRGLVVSVTNANPPVCTLGTYATAGTRDDSSASQASACCLLSPTKVLVISDANDTIAGVFVFTISGTTVTAGAVLTVETVAAAAQLTYIGSALSRTRYNPILFPLSASTALFSYVSTSSPVSRSVILTESAGTLTAGTILYNSVSSASTANNAGNMCEQGTSDFLAIRAQGTTTFSRYAVPHKISGTTITSGASMIIEKLGLSGAFQAFGTRLSSGDYLLSQLNSSASELVVVRTNGDSINYRQTIKMPFGANGNFAYPFPKVSSNRIVLIGRPFGSTINANSTFQLRLVNIEIAA